MLNKNIEVFVEVLSKLQLDVVTSLARRRFLRLLNPFIDDFKMEVKELQEKYGIKENGKLKIEGNQIQFTAENKKIFRKEFDYLQNLNIEIDFSNSEEDKKTCIVLIEKELTEFTEKNKDGMDAVSFDYLAILREILIDLNK